MNRKYSFVIWFLFLTVRIYGQVNIYTETNSKEVRMNEQFIFTVALEIAGDDIEDAPVVKLPDLSRFEIIGNTSEHFTQTDSRSRTRINQFLYQLVLEPKQAGRFKIGSAQVQINGKTYKSEAFDMVIKDGDRSSDYNSIEKVYLNLEINQKEIYENQSVIAALRVYSNDIDNLRKIKNITLPEQKGFKIYLLSNKKEDVENDFDLSSQIIATYIIIPEKSGSLTVPPISATVNGYLYGNLLSNKLKINVNPLPEAPPTYRNAVGDFKLEFFTLKKEKKIEINTPIDVLVKISGSGNLKNIAFPSILESENYVFFKPKNISNIIPKAFGFSGSVSQHYVLIPKKEGEFSIKLEPFSFFDPREKKYVNLHVEQLRIVSLSSKEILKHQSTIDQMIDNTNQFLKTVKLPQITKESDRINQKKAIDWSIVLVNLFLVLGLSVFLFSFKIKEKTKKKTTLNQHENTSKSIAEIEEQLKKNLELEFQLSITYLRNLNNNQQYKTFFLAYETFHQEIEHQILTTEHKSLEQFLEEIHGSSFLEHFLSLRNQIQIEKFAPIHDEEHMNQLTKDIERFYSRIEK